MPLPQGGEWIGQVGTCPHLSVEVSCWRVVMLQFGKVLGILGREASCRLGSFSHPWSVWVWSDL